MFKSAVSTFSNTSQPEAGNDFRQFLENEFIRRANRNGRYTLSAYARSLGTDVSTLSKIFRGQRQLKKEAIERYGLKLGLSPSEILRFQKNAPRKNARPPEATVPRDEVGENYQQLTLDSFQVISDWYHYALLELMALPLFKNDFQWIARALRISETEARIAFDPSETARTDHGERRRNLG